MKILLFLHIVVMIVICACNSVLTKDEVRLFMPGTYFRASVHEFGSEYDTIAITLQNADARQYKITRKWKYERIIDGKPIEPEYKRQVTTGIYNIYRKMLKETETGDNYSFDPQAQLLFIGSTKYKKL